ncbi:helix-turn-helix domain-containing protein [Mesorhizobium sp. ASY16-5R]|uniref:helix-turn-helix domain-containing protein n=1 Tax=Mesorhizobium sp. ASY16-5R TaxID=3445772 RepID=UPI003FA0BD61
MPISSFTSISTGSIHSVPAGLLAANAPAADDTPSTPRTSRASVKVGLPHMGVVLSLSADAVNGGGLDFVVPATSEAMASDPVMKRLFDQLGRSGIEESEDDDAYADAIRVALAARWLKLRSREQEESTEALQKWRLKRVLAYIDENLGETVSLADLAHAAGLSRMYFAARFRTATGLRPHDYLLQRRIDRAKELLSRTEETLVNIALDVGFQTQAHFTTVFKKFAGSTPARWRADNRCA